MKLDKSLPLPMVLSIGMHSLLLILILGNWDFFKKDEEPYKPHYVTATLVDLTPKAKAAPQQIKEQTLDSKAYEDMKHLKKQEEKRRKEAEAKVQKQKDEQAKAAADAEKLKQQKIKEEQAKAAKAKAEAERKKKLAEEQKQKAEAEKKRKQEQQAQEEQRRIQAALQKEEKLIAESNDEANVKSYNELIAERVGQNWSRPPSARRGMIAVFNIEMLPNGQVVGVQLIQSSGSDAFDRAAEQAIRKVDRFTEIKDIPIAIFERNFRHFKFAFNPEDLRQ